MDNLPRSSNPRSLIFATLNVENTELRAGESLRGLIEIQALPHAGGSLISNRHRTPNKKRASFTGRELPISINVSASGYYRRVDKPAPGGGQKLAEIVEFDSASFETEEKEMRHRMWFVDKDLMDKPVRVSNANPGKVLKYPFSLPTRMDLKPSFDGAFMKVTYHANCSVFFAGRSLNVSVPFEIMHHSNGFKARTENFDSSLPRTFDIETPTQELAHLSLVSGADTEVGETETKSYRFGDTVRGLITTPKHVHRLGGVADITASLICVQTVRDPELLHETMVVSVGPMQCRLKRNLDFALQLPYIGHPPSIRQPNMDVCWMLRFKFTVEAQDKESSYYRRSLWERLNPGLNRGKPSHVSWDLPIEVKPDIGKGRRVMRKCQEFTEW